MKKIKEVLAISFFLILVFVQLSCSAKMPEEYEKGTAYAIEQYYVGEEGRLYYEYEILGYDRNEKVITIYAMVSTIWMKDNGEMRGSNKDIPLCIYLSRDNLSEVLNIEEPYEGEDYEASVKEIFPSNIALKILAYNGDQMYERLEKKAGI